MKNHYECIVIGGGIAGATMAYHLAKLGYNVAVLEKKLGPHHKVCGEFLSFEAISYLQEMGISLGEDSPAVKYFHLVSPHAKASFTFPSAGRGISRYKLDEKLLDNAGDAGADIFRGVSMREYHKQDNGLFKIETNTDDFYAEHVFMAIGKHDYSKEHKRFGKDNAYIGLKTHIRLGRFSETYKETTVLFSFPGGYGGICPVEGGITNFCFVIEKKMYRSLNGNFNDAVSYLRRLNPALDAVLQAADFMEEVCAVGHIPYGFLHTPSNEDHVYFAGDQRMVIPSLTGDGMAIALSTARHCAYGFNGRQKGLKVEDGPQQRMLEKQMHWALIGHAILKYPWAIDTGLCVPGLGAFLIEMIFKKTRVAGMKDNPHDHRETIFKNNYSRR